MNQPPRQPTGQHPAGERPGEHPEESGELFDLSRLYDYAGFALRAPFRRPGLALGAFLAVFLLGIAALFTVPIRWEVQASVLAQRSALMGTLSNPGMNREWDSPTRSAREMLLRRDNLVALCEQTNFVDRYLAGRAPVVRLRDWIVDHLGGKERTREALLDGIVDVLDDRLWVTVSPEGTLTIGFTWTDRDLTFDFVAAAMRSFMEERYATEIKMIGETISILEGHDARVVKEVTETVSQLEEKLRLYRTRARPRTALAPAPAPARAVASEDLTRLEATLRARKRALAGLDDFRQHRLVELQNQLTQQLGVYAPEHPIVIGLRRELDAANAPSAQSEALRTEIQDLEREVARRGGNTDDPLPAVPGLPGGIVQMESLRSELDDPRLEYHRRQLDLLLRQHSQLLERIDAARIEMDTAQAAFKYRYKVVSPPKIPKAPIRPYKLMFIGGGLVGGIMLALFLATAADLRSGRILERWQVEQELKLPVSIEIRR